MSLPVSRLVRVSVNLSPTAAPRRNFGILCVAGDSDVISAAERIRSYDSYEEVASDFGVEAPESQAAAAYFGQVPKPRTINVARWFRTAAAAKNLGGILNATEQLIATWQAISNGGFVIVIDGVTKTLSSLDFTAQTNLNGVADIINASLTGGSVVWNGTNFVVSSDTLGDGEQATGNITLTGNPSPGVQASGTITLTGNPANGNTVEINGTTVTFVSGSPTGNQVLIGADEDETAENLQTFLEASANAGLAACLYNTIGLVTTITARVYGTAGNAYTLAKVGANITVSGAGTLASGVAADTLTVNGVALTFVAATPTGNQILVGIGAPQTAANIQAFLAASVNVDIAEATYVRTDQVIAVTAVEAGTAGNSFTIAESSSAITVSATLSGGTQPSSVSFATAGSGTDISALLKLTSATSQGLVAGADAETPAECALELANFSSQWYGLCFQASTQPTDDQALDVAAVIEALSLKRVYGVTITNTNVLSAVVTNDLASRMVAAGYKQSFGQYSSNAYAINSLFGRMFSVNFSANRSTITLMYKQEPGITGEELTTTQANTLKVKRCNVYVNYVNSTKIIQYGTMFGPAYIDEIHGLDWLQDAVQNNCFNAMYTSKTKIPQTDPGVNQLVNACNEAYEEGVNNGLIAPGVWNSDPFGQLNTGDYLKDGYYTFAQSVDLQSQAERDTRTAPPITSAIKLAGAIQEVDVIINVNR